MCAPRGKKDKSTTVGDRVRRVQSSREVVRVNLTGERRTNRITCGAPAVQGAPSVPY